jgi:PPM family protein phosphatase
MQIYGRSDRGRVRGNNEDCFAIDPRSGIAVLADGMGGQSCGEVASACAVRAAMDELERAATPTQASADADADADADAGAAMRRAFAAAHRSVQQHAAADVACSGMGTTLVAAWVRGQRCMVGHLGDSRAYRYRRGRLERLTSDHSLVQELVDAGALTADDARHAPNRNIITRGVGMAGELGCDLYVGRFDADDWLLLCSDGLTDLLDDAAIEQQFADVTGRRAARTGTTLRRLVDGLIATALERGGFDNVTVVAMHA